MNGSLPFSAVWDETAAVKQPQPDSLIYFRKAHLYPNGDLLAIYEAAGDTPWGYGLVKMDKNSRPIWKYLQHAHHDLDVGSDGRIYVLTHEIRSTEIRYWRHLATPRIDDFVVVLSPEGEELQKISVVDAFIASPFARMVNQVAWYTEGDYFHTNSIDLLEPAAASALMPGARQPVLLSMRELGAIGILDLADERFGWALRGSWVGQHDPDLLPNGNMLLFDNYGHYGEGGISRVIEFDPRLAGDRLAVHRRQRPAVLQRGALGAGASRQRQHADHGIRRRAAVRGDARGRDRVGVPEPGARRRRRASTSRSCPWGQRIDPATLDPDFLGADELMRTGMTAGRLAGRWRDAARRRPPRPDPARVGRGSAGALARVAPYVVLVLAIAFLAFVAGSFLTFTGASSRPSHLTDAFRGGQALLEKQTQYDTPFPSDFWQPARTEAQAGSRSTIPPGPFDGFTLYTSGHAPEGVPGLDDRRGRARMAAAVQRRLGRQRGGPGPAARRSRLRREGASAAQRRPAGAVRRDRHLALGSGPGQAEPGLRGGLEISAAGPPRLRRRRGRQDLCADPRDPHRSGRGPRASGAAADRRLRRGAVARGPGAEEGLAARRARELALRRRCSAPFPGTSPRARATTCTPTRST